MFQNWRDSRKLKAGSCATAVLDVRGRSAGRRAFDSAIAVGTALLYCAIVTPGGTVAAPQRIGALAGLLLIAGLWTPVARIVVACAEAWLTFSLPAHPAIPTALALLGVTLALIGPAQWSVDARLYGRKHFVSPQL